MEVNIQFPDGSIKRYQEGVTLEEIAQGISPSLRKKVIAGMVNGMMVDLGREIRNDASIQLIERNSEEGIKIMRHSTAHVLAQAIKRLYHHVDLSIGPVIENGFYYDVDVPESITVKDLGKIEKEMKKSLLKIYLLKGKSGQERRRSKFLQKPLISLNCLMRFLPKKK